MKNITTVEDNIISTESNAKDNLRITPNEIEAAKRWLVYLILNEEMVSHEYIRIGELFEKAHISNDQLISILDEGRPIPASFQAEILLDMTCALSREILSNPVLGELFVSLYSKKYVDSVRIAQGIIKNGNIRMKKKLEAMNRGAERFFCLFLLLNSDCVLDGTNLDEEILLAARACADQEDDYGARQYELFFEIIKEITFSETEDSVFFSKQFERFLSKRRNEIAEFLRVEECKISDTIITEMDFSDDTREKYHFSKKAKQISELVLMGNHGNLSWLRIFAGNTLSRGGYYKPDIDRIITNYYIVQVMFMYGRSIYITGKFTKQDLSKRWKTDPERDMQGIGYMYCLDVFYNMFTEMMKEYYRRFPWSNFFNGNIQDRCKQMENKLNKIIEEQKKEISSLNGQISLLESQYKKEIFDSNNKIATKYERESGKLNKKIEQKDREILKLKAYIKSQEEFIALQDSTEPEDVEIVDEGYLQSRKYLFVGDAEEALPELKKKFPNSIFMQSETANISKVSVDMIVFLIKWMSHGMYYKVKNSKIYQKVPSVMCNTKNINRIYYDMDRQQAIN